MTKFRLLFIATSVALFLWILATAVMAQGEPPPPYAGLENPFSWSDESVQEVGEGLYQRSCLGCHGATGGSLARADFSAADYPPRLEERPDFYFWILSEGRLNEGMPAFKSSLSEEQRWQILTYLWSLGAVVPPDATPPAEPPAEGADGILLLTAPEQAQSGQPMTISAALRDKDGKLIGNTPVKFFIRVNFFASDLIEIGEAMTNAQGTAVLEYTPRQTGDIQIVARYESIETTTTVNLVESAEPFYQAEAGLPPAVSLPEVFVGPKSALEPGEGATAPTTGLRIPGGLPFILLLAYVFTVILVWGLYLRVMYQLLRIPIGGEIKDTNTRLIPWIGIAVMVAFVTVLVLILITGPYSHPHLSP